MMAEMVAGEKKAENTDTDSDDGGNGAADDDDDANDAGTVMHTYVSLTYLVMMINVCLNTECRLYFPFNEEFNLMYYRKCCRT